MYKKTEIIKKIVENLKDGNQLNMSIYKAGAKPGTVWLWRKANPRLEKLIKAAQAQCDSKRDSMVVDSLFKQAVAGNPTAIAIYLKFKMGWKDSPLVDQSSHSHLTIYPQKTLIFKDLKDAENNAGTDNIHVPESPASNRIEGTV